MMGIISTNARPTDGYILAGTPSTQPSRKKSQSCKMHIKAHMPKSKIFSFGDVLLKGLLQSTSCPHKSCCLGRMRCYIQAKAARLQGVLKDREARRCSLETLVVRDSGGFPPRPPHRPSPSSPAPPAIPLPVWHMLPSSEAWQLAS